MMDSLFAKLDAISVTATNLPSADQTTIDHLHQAYKATLTDLDTAKRDIENHQTDSAWLTKKNERLLKELAEDRDKARNEHIANIIGHFNSSHDLGLQRPHEWNDETKELRDDQLTTFVTDWVLEQLGGKSFLDIATEKLVDEFQRMTWNVKRSRRNVTLQGFVYVEDDFSGHKRLSYRYGDKLKLLAKAIGRFERDNTDAPMGLLQSLQTLTAYDADDLFGQAIETYFQKCQQVTVFKNGNVRLTFADDATAAAFTTFYRLKLVD